MYNKSTRQGSHELQAALLTKYVLSNPILCFVLLLFFYQSLAMLLVLFSTTLHLLIIAGNNVYGTFLNAVRRLNWNRQYFVDGAKQDHIRGFKNR